MALFRLAVLMTALIFGNPVWAMSPLQKCFSNSYKNSWAKFKDLADQPMRKTVMEEGAIVIDTNIAMAANHVLRGSTREHFHAAVRTFRKLMGDRGTSRFWVSDQTAIEVTRGRNGFRVPRGGTRLKVELPTKKAQEAFENVRNRLKDAGVGGLEDPAGDLDIVTEILFAQRRGETPPTFATMDSGIYRALCELSPHCTQKKVPLYKSHPGGFLFSIEDANGVERTMQVIAIPSK